MATPSSTRTWRARLFEPAAVGRMSPAGLVLSYAILILWSAFVIFPAYWFTISTFKQGDTDFAGPRFVPFVDFEPTLDFWRNMFNYYPNCTVPDIARQLFLLANNAAAYVLSPLVQIELMEPRICRVWQSVTNSLITSIGATALSILIGSMAAYALARLQYKPKLGHIVTFVVLCFGMIVATAFRGAPWYVSGAVALALFFLLVRSLGRFFNYSVGNDAVRLWFISQRIIPPVVMALPIFMMAQKLGLLDTTAALIIVYATINLPIVIWFMHDFIAAVPLELEESAMMEGASRFMIFREIVLPLTRAGLAAITLLCLILNWNEYIIAVTLTTRYAPTLPVFAELWGESNVILIMIIPPIVMAIFLQRYISSGVLLGGVKG